MVIVWISVLKMNGSQCNVLSSDWNMTVCACAYVCACVCVLFLTASAQFNPTRWPEDCMYVDSGRMVYGLWIHFVHLVCLFVSLPVSLSVSKTVCSSACLPLFVSIGLSIFHLDLWSFFPPPYLSYFYFFHHNLCLTLCPAVFLTVCLTIIPLSCQLVFNNYLSFLSVFFMCCRQSLTCTSPSLPFPSLLFSLPDSPSNKLP